MVRNCDDGAVACEPRHSTWFATGAHLVMTRHAVARVARGSSHREALPRPWRPGRHGVLPAARQSANVLIALRRRISARERLGHAESHRL